MSSSHGYNLRPNVDSRVNKRVEDMVDAYGGPERVTGKRSATGLGVHLMFRYESPKPSHNPRPRRFTHAPPEGDVEMVDSTESESGSSLGMDSSQSSSSSDADTVEPNPPCSAHCIPSLILQTPKPRRPEDLHRASHRRDLLDREEVEAARRRVEAQRRQEAKRIHIEQLQKQARLEAWKLRQRADDLEQEAGESAARLLQEDTTPVVAMDEDKNGFDVQSNHSYPPTETSESSDDDEQWLSPPPLRFHTPTSQTRHIEDFERSQTPTQPATPPPSQLGPQVRMETHRHAQPETTSFVVVSRQVVDGLNVLTGLPVLQTKQYRVHAMDLESLYGDFNMEELKVKEGAMG